MKKINDLWKAYSHYFLDFWQYLVIVVLFIVAALIFL